MTGFCLMTRDEQIELLLAAALPHVVFDGWGEVSFDASVADCGMDVTQARLVCPRGAVDLAVAYHEAGDRAMLDALAHLDLAEMRIRDKVSAAVMARLSAVSDKELVRRGSALFALPQHAGDGARLIWGTADAIWTALGDSSDDVNWYSKRATLSAVYGATVLFWLGDTGDDDSATRSFLDRRIENIMQFEKLKAQLQKAPVLGKVLDAALGGIKAPAARDDLPGIWVKDRV